MPLRDFGENSTRIIADFTPEAFAARTGEHLRSLAAQGPMERQPLRGALIGAAALAWSKMGWRSGANLGVLDDRKDAVGQGNG